MTGASLRAESELIPRVDVGEGIEVVFRWVKDNLSGFFNVLRDLLDGAVNGLADLLSAPDALLLAVLFALLAWLVKDIKFAALALVMLVFVISVNQWENAMDTLAMVLVAAIIALVIAIPLGIVAARSTQVSAVVRPVMDLMQTMPAFVWLVPVVSLFSIGVAPGVVATVIFCLPPGVRLTELGIRGVDSEVVEAGHSFGSSPGQILRGIQLPLAMPTIMAGVNQVIMLALSMAVIAGLVGAGGLGGAVATSIARIDIGLGFEAGLSVVALAIFLDRFTAAIGQGGRSPILTFLRRGRRAATPDTPPTAQSGT
ncbi:ABC transporter permease [Aeromicrobium sp. CTD01-1L150]|uniref:ABC transporter permease n=1 Tax=Aeromicrobium sp. CTD01-1L150 TaxID=3341830 RepID=UPI0035BEBE00